MVKREVVCEGEGTTDSVDQRAVSTLTTNVESSAQDFLLTFQNSTQSLQRLIDNPNISTVDKSLALRTFIQDWSDIAKHVVAGIQENLALLKEIDPSQDTTQYVQTVEEISRMTDMVKNTLTGNSSEKKL